MEPLFSPIDFEWFHRDELPRRIAGGNGALAARGAAGLGPLAFRVDGGSAWTYVPRDGTIEIVPGVDPAATVVTLEQRAWELFAHQLRTVAGLAYTAQLDFERGGFDQLAAWEPALRALYNGRPTYDQDSVNLTDRVGEPLDLHRSFGLDDDPADLAQFLQETGYLRVRGVFSPDEIEALCAQVGRLADEARPGDGASWWAENGAGETVLCRLTYAGLKSERLAALDDDERVRRLAGLSGALVAPVPDRMDGHIVVLKIPGATSGLADLPWHFDCGLGGHSVLCPSVLVGIQLDAATADTGQLHFVPGSWRCANRSVGDADAEGLPTVAVDTEPGDCTVHFGDALHAAPPPRAERQGRRTIYVQFYSPAVYGVIPKGGGFNDMIMQHDAAVPKTVDEMVGY